jgi:hypothetical protein
LVIWYFCFFWSCILLVFSIGRRHHSQ